MTAPEGIDPKAFKSVLGRFATGITIMSTLQDGVAHAMTANAFTSVSLDPPLVLVCVDKEVRMHDAVLACGSWGVSMLSVGQCELAERFAHSGRDLYSQFDGVPTWPGPATGCPLIEGALSWLECRTWATYEGGDHTIVVGEVIALGEGTQDSALTYFSGKYRSVT